MNEAMKRAQKKYESKCRTFCLRFNKEKDADILSWLELKENVNRFIKTLINDDMKKNKNRA